MVTLVFNFLIAFWVNDDADNAANDQSISTIGIMYVRGLEIYGGNLKSESGKDYIDWGELFPGASKHASFYVESTSNVDVVLELNVTGWTPAEIADYISISWNYTGTLLSPDHEPLLVTVNLDISSSREFIRYLVANNVTTFGFDINIYASSL